MFLNVTFVLIICKAGVLSLKFNILHEKSIFEDRIFEFIFAEVWIKNNKKIIVGNIYRPSVNHPTLTSSEQYQQFMELLTNLLSSFSELNQQIFLFGDFNLDALKYNIIGNVTEYIDMLFSYGFLQIVMKPTRCTQHSASLIKSYFNEFEIRYISNSNSYHQNLRSLSSNFHAQR